MADARSGKNILMNSIRLRFDHGAPAAVARQAARTALTGWRASYPLEDVLLVVTELVHNVTRHTADGGELVLTLRADCVLVEVNDTSAVLPTLRQRATRIGGRGLLLVAAVAKRWGARSRAWAGHAGKVVWAEVGLRPDVPETSVAANAVRPISACVP